MQLPGTPSSAPSSATPTPSYASNLVSPVVFILARHTWPLTAPMAHVHFARVQSDYSLDPLSAPTVQERIRALYLAAGYNRRQFAITLGVGYSVVANWDNGRHVPTVPLLRQVCELLEVSTDDVIYGPDPRPTPADPKAPRQGRGAGAGSIDLDALRMALDRIHASALAREALADHMASPRGKLQRVTADYALHFAHAYDEEIARGASAERAAGVAYREAVNARARADATQSRARSTSSPAQRSASPPRKSAKTSPKRDPIPKKRSRSVR